MDGDIGRAFVALKQSKLDVSASGERNATDTPVCLSHQKGFVGDMEFDGWANNGGWSRALGHAKSYQMDFNLQVRWTPQQAQLD